MKFYLFLFLSLFICNSAWAQPTTISGKVTDPHTGEELINATIQLFKEGVFQQGTVTDFSGNYKINTDPGAYDVLCTYLGYADEQIDGAIVQEGQNNILHIEMGGYEIIDCVFNHFDFTIPLMDREPPTEQVIRDSKQIRSSPIRGIKQIATSAAGISFQ